MRRRRRRDSRLRLCTVHVRLQAAALNAGDPAVLAGLLYGVVLFAALTMISVGKAAAEVIIEVRRQFAEVSGLRHAIELASQGIAIPAGEDVDPESDKCHATSTRSSVREMVAPGGYAILAPLFVGFMVGRQM